MACQVIAVNQLHADVITAQELAATGGAALVGNLTTGWTELSGSTIQAVLDNLDDYLVNVAKLTGRSGGQTLKGGTASGDDLTLESTSNATEGTVISADDFETQKAFIQRIGTVTDLSADVNNLDIDASGGRCSFVEQGVTASGVDITGIAGGVSGRRITFRNTDDVESLTFKHENTGSTAANRITTPDAGDFVLGPGRSIDLFYSGTSSRWIIQAQPLGNGYRLKATTRYTSGSGTYNTPTGVRALVVRCWGGGGGGGGVSGATSQAAGAGGGGAGGYCEKLITGPSSSYSYGVGGAGSGGTSGANNGDVGGDTTFGSSLLTANGGGGGTAMATGTAVADVAGGNGGSSSGGDVNIAGTPGGMGVRLNGTFAYSTYGGDPIRGVGASGPAVRNAGGSTATGYSAGGGGAATVGNTDRAGGNGVGGLIEIEEYY
jgi:hypothetical protein